MPTYLVTQTETITREYEVEASTPESAVDMVEYERVNEKDLRHESAEWAIPSCDEVKA